MSLRKLIISSALATSLLVPFAAGAKTGHKHDAGCALAGYNVTQVTPYRVEERAGRGTIQRLAGAELFIPAEPGLTRELIAAKVLSHLQTMRTSSMPGCPLDVDRITVTVKSGTTGYWVQIAGKNAGDARQILERAQQLVR